MSFFNRLTAVILTAILIGPVAPVQAKTRKGDKYLAEGRVHEVKKEWDAALQQYENALSEDPADVVYQMSAQKARFQAAQMHLDRGLKVREQGQLGEALLEFQKAYGLNPGSSAAEQEIRRTQEMIQRERQRVLQTGKEAPPEERALTPVEQAKKESEEKLKTLLPVPELKPLSNEPINLKMNNQSPRVLFETVAKVAGINVLWDPDMNPPPNAGRNLSIELNNETLDQALDDLATLTKFFWKPLSTNTIFITNDNVNKRRDYEDQVMKVFYLSNVNTAQEIQEIINAVRTLTELNRIMPYNSQNAIIVRGEADRVALAERIISDLDKPKSEVVVDIVVLQASSAFTRSITAALASTGLNVPVSFSPRPGLQVVQNPSTVNNNQNNQNNQTPSTTPTTTPSVTTTPTGPLAIPLSNLGHLASSDFSITLPGALLNAALSDANTKVLQSPQIRSVDNVKASLKIGDREPTATGSFQPGIGGVGINPLVNTQFTYIDVGVNVDITPRVHDNGEVSMHVELDISNVSGTVNLGGLSQPIISQKKVIHDIRMKEGEVNLLGGLIVQQEDKTVTGIPGLASIPLLGRLFSGESVDHSRSELMIALIPHIIRRPEITPENLRGIMVGNATTIRLNYGPRAPEAPAPRAAAANPPATPPAAANPPATAPPATAPPIAPPATAPPAPNAPPGGNASVRFLPDRIDTNLPGTFTVAVAVNNATDAVSAPMQIQFDPRVLRLNDVSSGDFLAQGGVQPVFAKNIQNDAGTATVQLSRPPGAAGVSGAGVLITLSFQTVARGNTTITITNAGVRNSQNQIIGDGNPGLAVRVQ
jgi:general secretion pathway protein D